MIRVASRVFLVNDVELSSLKETEAKEDGVDVSISPCVETTVDDERTSSGDMVEETFRNESGSISIVDAITEEFSMAESVWLALTASFEVL